MANRKHHFNITVGNDTLENDLKKIVSIVRSAWKEDEVQFKRSDTGTKSGLLNLMVFCYQSKDYKKNAIVFRMHLDRKIKEFLNHEHESQFVQIVHTKLGFAPDILAVFNNGFCYNYIVGESMSWNSVEMDDNWKTIAKQLALLHSIKPDDCLKHKSKIIDFYDGLIQTFPQSLQNTEDDRKLKTFLPAKSFLLEEYNKILNEVANIGSEYVFCHGDTRPENFIWNRETGQITFIDWECSGMDRQAYEIAYHFLRYAGIYPPDFSLCPDEEFRLKFLRVYLETYFTGTKPNISVQNCDVRKLYVQVQKHFLMLLIQSSGYISSLKLLEDVPIDLLSMSIAYYDEYVRIKNEILQLK